MLTVENRLPAKLPEVSTDRFDAKKFEQSGDNAAMPNFDKLMFESNNLKQEELEKQKSTLKDGELHVGESKNDKEFREQLEKITGKKQDKLKNKMDKDDYLNLMVTQLKNQDPSKPMEHFEMATQLAQFNTVEQIMGTNKILGEMNKIQSEIKADKLAQYIGKEVEIQGNNMTILKDNTVTAAKFQLPTESPAVNVDIKDAKGNKVRTLALEKQDAGSHDIVWDGKDAKGMALPSGAYTFSVQANTIDGKPLAAKTSYKATVTGVSDIATGGKLETVLGSVESAKIIAVRNAEPKSKPKPAPLAAAGKAPAVSSAPTAAAAAPVQAKPAQPVTQGAAPQASTPVQAKGNGLANQSLTRKKAA